MPKKNQNIILKTYINEKISPKNSKRNSCELTGRTENNRVVNFPGKPELKGKIVKLLITELRQHTLRGKIL